MRQKCVKNPSYKIFLMSFEQDDFWFRIKESVKNPSYKIFLMSFEQVDF